MSDDTSAHQVVDWLLGQREQISEDRARWLLANLGVKRAHNAYAKGIEVRIAADLLREPREPAEVVGILAERRGLSERTARRRVNAAVDELCQLGHLFGRTAREALLGSNHKDDDES